MAPGESYSDLILRLAGEDMKVGGAPGAEWLESFLTRGHGGLDPGRARRAGWEHRAITLTAKTQSGNSVLYLGRRDRRRASGGSVCF